MRVPIPPANSHGALHNPVPKNGSDAGAIAPCCRLLIGRNLTHDLGLENKLLYQKGKNIQFLPSGFHRFFLLRSSIAVLGYLGECTVHFCGEDSGYGVISTMCLRGVPFPIFGRYSWITVDADRLRSTVSYECVQICDTRHYCQFLVSFFFLLFHCRTCSVPNPGRCMYIPQAPFAGTRRSINRESNVWDACVPMKQG